MQLAYVSLGELVCGNNFSSSAAWGLAVFEGKIDIVSVLFKLDANFSCFIE